MHWSIPCFFILACHVYLMLCSILLCLKFELHFLIHLATFMHHCHCSYLHLLPSFLLDPLSIPDKKGESILSLFQTKRGRVYSREYTGVFFVISIWLLCTSLRGEILILMHICRGRDIPYGRCIYPGGEDIVLIRKLYSVCFLVGFMVLWVMLCCSHCIMFVL